MFCFFEEEIKERNRYLGGLLLRRGVCFVPFDNLLDNLDILPIAMYRRLTRSERSYFAWFEVWEGVRFFHREKINSVLLARHFASVACNERTLAILEKAERELAEFEKDFIDIDMFRRKFFVFG